MFFLAKTCEQVCRISPATETQVINLRYCSQFKSLPRARAKGHTMKDDCNHRHCIRGLTTYKSPVNNSVTSRSVETHESNNFRIHVKSSAETDVRAAKTSARYFYWRWNKTELVVLKKLNRLYFTQILVNATVKTSLFLVCVAGEDSRKLRERNEITGFCCCFVPRENNPPTAQASRQLSPRSEFPTRAKSTDGNTTRDMLVRFLSENDDWNIHVKFVTFLKR